MCLSLGLPHQGDSDLYSRHTIFSIKGKITQNYPKSAAMGFCSKGLMDGFETAVVNKPSVFQPSKFYYRKSQEVHFVGIMEKHGDELIHLNPFLHGNP